MNKNEFIRKLSKELNYEEDKCIIINEVLENNFFISKKSKDVIIQELILKLGVDDKGANNIYDVALKIVKEEIKDKIKHPFRNQD